MIRSTLLEVTRYITKTIPKYWYNRFHLACKGE